METDKKKQIEPYLEQLQERDTEYTKDTSMSLFVKVGIIVLSIILIIGFGIKILPDAVTVSNIGKKNDLPIYCVNTKEKKVALTFDTEGDNADIKSILATLDKYGVKATFFMTGSWVEQYPEEVKEVATAGHDLANHSEKHTLMSRLTREQCIEDIRKAHNRVKKLTGVDMNLFRAPYGDYNNTLVGAARDCGYDTIQWDVDSEDWKDYGVNTIVKDVLNNKDLGNGSIILMHNGAKYTPDALESVIKGLLDKGYEIVPISQLIYTRDYLVDQSGRQFAK